GSPLPVKDDKAQYERYCRLMLIFFKPWRHISDLRNSFQGSWSDAFQLFQCSASPYVNRVLLNIQALQECKSAQHD
ncbi:hypothetical protein BC629DRAFT_1268749, partial [Irpex lacteus]